MLPAADGGCHVVAAEAASTLAPGPGWNSSDYVLNPYDLTVAPAEPQEQQAGSAALPAEAGGDDDEELLLQQQPSGSLSNTAPSPGGRAATKASSEEGGASGGTKRRGRHKRTSISCQASRAPPVSPCCHCQQSSTPPLYSPPPPSPIEGKLGESTDAGGFPLLFCPLRHATRLPQVPGCGEELLSEKKYYQRYRICVAHSLL